MEYKVIENRQELSELISELLKSNTVCLDVECTSLDVFSAIWLLLQLEVSGKIFVLDVRKLKSDILYIIQLIKDSNKLVLGHNIKFDNQIIYVNTGEMLENCYDTMISEVLINQGIGEQYYSYVDLVSKYCMVTLDKTERKTFENYSEEFFTSQQLQYSALDVRYLKDIRNFQIKALENQKQLQVLDLECKLIPVVCSMELSGVLLDKDLWRAVFEKVKIESEQKRNELVEYFLNKIDLSKYENLLKAFEAFSIPVTKKKEREQLEQFTSPETYKEILQKYLNVNSPAQVKSSLNLLGLDVPSTGEKVLDKFIRKEKAVEFLFEYREKEKRLTTYGENYFNLINPKTGRIHVDFNQVGTYTGRFAVSRLHQIPKDTDYRNPFIPRPGYKLITADYDQAELRLLGADSAESKFIDAYLNNIDLHKVTASVIFNKSIEDITKEERQTGKTFNFAVIYGTTEYGLYMNFGIPLSDGKIYLHRYYENYDQIKKYQDYLGEKCYNAGFCPTMFGRRRYYHKKTLFADWKAERRYKSSTIRELLNHRIQGTCADMIKLAMVQIYFNNPFGPDGLRILMQVHDELVIEVREDVFDSALEFIKINMLNAEQGFLDSISASVGIGKNFNHWSK